MTKIINPKQFKTFEPLNFDPPATPAIEGYVRAWRAGIVSDLVLRISKLI
jgi:hypothetical protein